MFKKTVALILICLSVYWSFHSLLPNKISDLNTEKQFFSTERALTHLKNISQKEHFVGSSAHEDVRNYIVNTLQGLGLKTQIQEGYSLSDKREFCKAKNIIAKINGTENTKSLLLLAHYDSEPHSSYGASDDGSGVVTILESIRAFLQYNNRPKNDIIILFSDAEELGLNGADIFVNEHEWAKDVGLVLNFETRGSGGPSIMLIETNHGNAKLVKEFVAANPKFPVGNSLAYSVYKMLPNDTDLTRFREDGDIDGFNFAFIDNHFNYHTALDTYEHLNKNSLEHQGSYLMPLLNYFSDASLNNLKSEEDFVYVNVPLFKMATYPFSWIFPMLILSLILFLILCFHGFRKGKIKIKYVTKGFAAFLGALIVSGLVAYFGWKLLNVIYPQYYELLQGFTYNGYEYIAMVVCFTLGVCFSFYHRVYNRENVASLLVAPIFFWLSICTIVAFRLKGASFFIIPVLFALVSMFVMLRQKKPNILLMALLVIPVVTIISPLVKIFPVGLGLKILFVSAILVVLVFGLSISVFGYFRHKNRLSYVFYLLAIWFLISAHLTSSFSEDRPKPNSLVYLLDTKTNTAVWATYDNLLDSFTENFLTNDPNDASKFSDIPIKSKYQSGFTFTKKAPMVGLQKPEITILKDTIIGDYRQFEISMISHREVNRIEVFTDTSNVFKTFIINNISVITNTKNAFAHRDDNRLFTYYVSDNEPLHMQLTVPKDQLTNLDFFESSYDLLNNSLFDVPNRDKDMIPKPFVINDAIIIKSSLNLN